MGGVADGGAPTDPPAPPAGGALAHAFLPRRGEAHFDRDERWSLSRRRGRNLFVVLAHEIGHTLGLPHSPAPRALMAPYYKRLGRDALLSWDDVLAVQGLYGEPPPCPPPVPRSSPGARTPARRAGAPRPKRGNPASPSPVPRDPEAAGSPYIQKSPPCLASPSQSGPTHRTAWRSIPQSCPAPASASAVPLPSLPHHPDPVSGPTSSPPPAYPSLTLVPASLQAWASVWR